MTSIEAKLNPPPVNSVSIKYYKIRRMGRGNSYKTYGAKFVMRLFDDAVGLANKGIEPIVADNNDLIGIGISDLYLVGFRLDLS